MLIAHNVELTGMLLDPSKGKVTPPAPAEREILRSLYRASVAVTTVYLGVCALPVTARLAARFPVAGAFAALGEALAIAIGSAGFAVEIANVSRGIDQLGKDSKSIDEARDVLDSMAEPLETIVDKILKSVRPDAVGYADLATALEDYKSAYNDRRKAKGPIEFWNAARREIEAIIKIKDSIQKLRPPPKPESEGEDENPPPLGKPTDIQKRPQDWQKGPAIVAPPPPPKPSPLKPRPPTAIA